MADVKHTPGPLAAWPSLYEGFEASVVVDGSDPLRTLAQVRRYRDACLYAAAPELLEEAREAAATFRKYEELHLAKGTVDGAQKAAANASRAKRLEEVVAKAEGRS